MLCFPPLSSQFDRAPAIQAHRGQRNIISLHKKGIAGCFPRLPCFCEVGLTCRFSDLSILYLSQKARYPVRDHRGQDYIAFSNHENWKARCLVRPPAIGDHRGQNHIAISDRKNREAGCFPRLPYFCGIGLTGRFSELSILHLSQEAHPL